MAGRWLEQKLMSWTDLQSLAVRELGEASRRCPIADEWFFHVSVTPSLERLLSKGFMRLGRRADMDHVDGCCREEFLERRMATRIWVYAPNCFDCRNVSICDGSNSGKAGQARNCSRMLL